MNMKTLIIVLLATLFFGGRLLYLYLQKRKTEDSKTMDIMKVEAGPLANAKKEDFTKPVSVPVGDLQIDPSLQYFLVRNECMKPLNIKSGDIIGVQLFDESFTIKDVKKGDILLIELDDEEFRGNKIRVMDYPENEAFHTYYYLKGKQKESSHPHSFKNIRGVVREINHVHKYAA